MSLQKVYSWASQQYPDISLGYRELSNTRVVAEQKEHSHFGTALANARVITVPANQICLSASFKSFSKSVIRYLDAGLNDKVYAEQFVEMVKELKA